MGFGGDGCVNTLLPSPPVAHLHESGGTHTMGTHRASPQEASESTRCRVCAWLGVLRRVEEGRGAAVGGMLSESDRTSPRTQDD